MTPHLLVVSRAFGANRGGMERLSFEFVAALRAADVTVEVVAHRGSRQTSPLFALACIPWVLLSARSAAIVHLGDPMLSLAGWLVKKMYGKPVVVTVHGLDITYQSSIYQWYLRSFFGGFDRYIAISRHVEHLLLERGHTNVVVIPPGVRDRHFDLTLTRRHLADLLGLNVDGRVVLTTVGRLVDRKGQAWFIKNVLPKLPEPTMYVIAGSGPGEAAIRQAIAETNVANRVRLLGHVTDDQLRILYNTVDAFVQPNIARKGDVEGFGLVLLEAALCNRLVFAAQLDGITDALPSDAMGKLLPSGITDAWVAALTPITPATHATTARAIALTTFDWKKIIQSYEALYNSLISRHDRK